MGIPGGSCISCIFKIITFFPDCRPEAKAGSEADLAEYTASATALQSATVTSAERPDSLSVATAHPSQRATAAIKSPPANGMCTSRERQADLAVYLASAVAPQLASIATANLDRSQSAAADYSAKQTGTAAIPHPPAKGMHTSMERQADLAGYPASAVTPRSASVARAKLEESLSVAAVHPPKQPSAAAVLSLPADGKNANGKRQADLAVYPASAVTPPPASVASAKVDESLSAAAVHPPKLLSTAAAIPKPPAEVRAQNHAPSD